MGLGAVVKEGSEISQHKPISRIRTQGNTTNCMPSLKYPSRARDNRGIWVRRKRQKIEFIGDRVLADSIGQRVQQTDVTIVDGNPVLSGRGAINQEVTV